MKMIKSFAEIEVDEDGNPLRDVSQPADTIENLKNGKLKNYKLFSSTEPPCEILQQEDFLKEKFGRYPVIYVDFQVARLTSYEEVLEHCRCVISKAYGNFKYLTKSDKLSEYHKKQIGKWLSKSVDLDEVTYGLKDLVEYLHMHFQRPVVVLIDEYDAVVTVSLFQLEDQRKLNNVCNLMTAIVLPLVKGQFAGKKVAKVLICGILLISGLDLSGRLCVVTTYKFGEEEDLVQYYGVTEDQLKKLVTKLLSKSLLPNFENRSVDNILTEIKGFYNGYYSEQGTEIYSLWGILHYLQSGEKISYWTKPSVISYFPGLLQYPSFVSSLLKLYVDETIKITVPRKIELHQLERLRDLCCGNCTYVQPDTNIFFGFLMELGYCSYTRNRQASPGKITIQISNEEIKEELLSFLKTGAQKIKGFDFKVMQACANTIKTMCFHANNKEEFEKDLQKLFEKLTDFFEGFKSFNSAYLSEAVVQGILLTLMTQTNFSRLSAESHAKTDDGDLIQKRIHLFVQDEDNKCYIIFELKYNPASKGKKSDKKSSKYALEEILGLKEKKGYCEALKKINAKTYILMGLSMDADCKPYISCLRNSKNIDDAIHLGEGVTKEN